MGEPSEDVNMDLWDELQRRWVGMAEDDFGFVPERWVSKHCMTPEEHKKYITDHNAIFLNSDGTQVEVPGTELDKLEAVAVESTKTLLGYLKAISELPVPEAQTVNGMYLDVLLCELSFLLDEILPTDDNMGPAEP